MKRKPQRKRRSARVKREQLVEDRRAEAVTVAWVLALIATLGAEAVDWSYKTDCCGGTLSLTQTPLALDMTQKILQNAHDCGADVITTACPLCHVNLDARQRQIGLDFQIPVLYITQLMTLAFGLGAKQAALSKNMVDPLPVLEPYAM